MLKAREQVVSLRQTIGSDVGEIRSGLPVGAAELVGLFKKPNLSAEDAQSAREALERARDKVQDLRVAKSTFFAVALTDGTVLRNDREQDLMATKNIFQPFPELKGALAGKYIETQGSMPEAAGVRGSPDGQWVAAQPVLVDRQVKGLYVTGWSWAAYAYRLENAVRTSARSQLPDMGKLPLLYVYLVVNTKVFGAPVSPAVNADAISKLGVLGKAAGDQPFVTSLSITDRDFGLAVLRTPALGANVAVAVLRSET